MHASVSRVFVQESVAAFSHRCRRQSKTLILATNIDQKSLETEFSTAIFRPTGLKTLFLSIFDPRSSIVKSVFNCHQPGVVLKPHKTNITDFSFVILEDF